MAIKEKFNIGELCIYRDMYVLILSKRKDLLKNKTDSTTIVIYDVLFPGQHIDTLSSSCLEKIKPAI